MGVEGGAAGCVEAGLSQELPQLLACGRVAVIVVVEDGWGGSPARPAGQGGLFLWSGVSVLGVEGGQDTERVEVGLHARRGA